MHIGEEDEMDILEKPVETHYSTENSRYYIAEVHMAVGNRLSREPDYWVCRRGSEVRVYLGNTLSRADVKKAVRIMEESV